VAGLEHSVGTLAVPRQRLWDILSVLRSGVFSAHRLTAVKMPNRDGFLIDDRPDSAATRCMSNCN